jgi:hypothetical protein
MSVKDKDKVDNTISVTSDNRDEEALTLTTITVVEFKKNTLVKIRELAVFTGDRIKFIIYKTSIGLAV